MRQLLIGVTAIASLVAIGPTWAQAPQPFPPAAYSAQRYPFPAPTPEDAYRGGLINRWELEQFQGRLQPQALQGPSVDGSKGGGDGRQ